LLKKVADAPAQSRSDKVSSSSSQYVNGSPLYVLSVNDV